MTRRQWTKALVVLCALMVLAWPAMAQPGPPPGGPGGFGGPGMMMPMPPMPMSPPVTMMIADGVVYVACNGVLTAYEAKTLKQLGQATYWQAPPPPQFPGPGGPPPPPAGPPPAAP